jgi:hypothetical protein
LILVATLISSIKVWIGISRESRVARRGLGENTSMTQIFKKLSFWSAVLGLALSTTVLSPSTAAQDQGQEEDDPPSRVARIGYLEGAVSFQPAGETDWVGAVPNRPLTTGDQLWSDQDSRAELQLGSAVLRLGANTGFSFLNLDDHTVQIQLTSGSLNVRVRRLDQNDVFEIDTPNLAFSISQPGNYRLTASQDGSTTAVSIRAGGGQATGNGQTYTLYAGQVGTFSGTDSLNADVEDIGDPDQFDNWASQRDQRYDNSRSSQYLSRDVVGFEDLDENGAWRDDSNYGHVWFPNQVAVGWAPYHTGHWAWISPWGYTWVDDSPWGYAPFHYGRWVSVGGRWGWIAGPVAVQPVYAPALVVFIGAGGAGFGGNIGWFPLGPREVYVPTYAVSPAYMNRVNISNTTVSTTTVTNVYNTTIINKTTITNVTYANRTVQGAVVVVPQHSFASAEPVARVAVAVSPQQIAAAPVSARVAVVPTHESVLGSKAASVGHVTAPPAAIRNRQVVAKTTPPPQPVPFAKQQQALAAHPGQPLAKHELQTLRPAGAAARPMVKQAPPGKPATPAVGHPTQPANQPNAVKPGQPVSRPPASSTNRPANQPAQNERPGAANSAQPARPMPTQPNNRPEPARPEANRTPATQPKPPETNHRTEGNQLTPAQPNSHPELSRPEPKANEHQPPPKPATPPSSERPQPRTAPAETKAPPPVQHPAAKPLTPEEKKQEEERQKREQEKPPGE